MKTLGCFKVLCLFSLIFSTATPAFAHKSSSEVDPVVMELEKKLSPEGHKILNDLLDFYKHSLKKLDHNTLLFASVDAFPFRSLSAYSPDKVVDRSDKNFQKAVLDLLFHREPTVTFQSLPSSYSNAVSIFVSFKKGTTYLPQVEIPDSLDERILELYEKGDSNSSIFLDRITSDLSYFASKLNINVIESQPGSRIGNGSLTCNKISKFDISQGAINPDDIYSFGTAHTDPMPKMNSSLDVSKVLLLDQLVTENREFSNDEIKALNEWAEKNILNCSPPPKLDEGALKGVVEEVRKSLGVLPRDTNFYHHQGIEKILPVQSGNQNPIFQSSGALDPNIRDYIKKYSERYYTLRSGGGSVGGGLYFAIDPSSTQGYGSGNLKITMKKGTRYLNVSGRRDTGFSDPTQSTLKSLGCDADSALGILQEPTCTAIAKFVSQKLNWTFLSYDYTGGYLRECSEVSRGRYGPAIMMFSDAQIIPEKTVLLNVRVPTHPSFQHDGELINQLTDRLNGYSGSSGPMSEEFKAFALDSTFGCMSPLQGN